MNPWEPRTAEEILEHVKDCQVLGDKGFIGAFWQEEMLQTLGVKVLTAKRKNQETQNPQEQDLLLGSLRQRIEGVFSELQNLGPWR